MGRPQRTCVCLSLLIAVLSAALPPAMAHAEVRPVGTIKARAVERLPSGFIPRIVSDGLRYVAYRIATDAVRVRDTRTGASYRVANCNASSAYRGHFLLGCRRPGTEEFDINVILDARSRRAGAIPGQRPGDNMELLGRHWVAGSIFCSVPDCSRPQATRVFINRASGERRYCPYDYEPDDDEPECFDFNLNSPNLDRFPPPFRGQAFGAVEPPFDFGAPSGEPPRGLRLRKLVPGRRPRTVWLTRNLVLNSGRFGAELKERRVTWTETRRDRRRVAIRGYVTGRRHRRVKWRLRLGEPSGLLRIRHNPVAAFAHTRSSVLAVIDQNPDPGGEHVVYTMRWPSGGRR